jgi:ribosome-associated translation inhibitor RaiA
MEANLSNLELHFEGVPLTRDVRTRIERRIEKWTRGHKDVTGISIAVSAMDASNTPHAFRARVVIYHRPENIAAVSKGPAAKESVYSALDAVERQLRETRDQLRERWKRPSATATEEE